MRRRYEVTEGIEVRKFHGFPRSWCVKHERWTGLPGWCLHCTFEGRTA